MPTPDALGRAVRQRRAELRLSQDDVRQASGLSVTTISKIEHGAPDLRVQRATMRRLDLALDWPVGTAESWYEGRAGILPASSTPMLLRIDEVVPAVLEALREQQGHSPEPVLTAKITRLPASIRRALEQLVDAIADELLRG